MKKFNELRKNEKGFTLIELIIVIAILAIIAAVAVPNIIGAVDNSRRSADVANAKIILNAAAQVQAKNNGAAFSVADGDEFDITTIAGPASGVAAADFEEALFVELNSATPTPKFKGAGAADVANFILVIGENNSMSVYASEDGAYAAADDVQVAPNPDTTAYTQQ